jgi:hypothetical protein
VSFINTDIPFFRTSIFFALLSLLATSARAAIPSHITVQGIVRDSGGNLLNNASLPISVQFYADEQRTMPVGSSINLSNQTLTDGLFTATVDLPQPLLGPLQTASDLWMQVTVNSEIYPPQHVTPELYALYCGNADSVTNGVYLDPKTNTLACSGCVTDANISGSIATARSFSGALGGDVSGTQSLTVVKQIQSVPVTATGAAVGQVLKFTASGWAPGNDNNSGGTVTSVTAIPPLLLGGTATAPNIGLGVVPPASGGTGISGSGGAGNYLRGVAGGAWASSSIQASDLPQVYVDLTNPQSVGGNKTFTASVSVNNNFAVGGNFNASNGAITSGTNGFVGINGGADTSGNDNLAVHAALNNGVGVYGPVNALGLKGQIDNGRVQGGVAGDSAIFATGAGLVLTSGGGGFIRIAGGGVSYSGFITNVSDARLKKNVKTIEHPLDDLLALRGVTFEWKSNGKPSIGFIAQEVEKVFPQIVRTDENGMKSVGYVELIGVIVEALREVSAEQTRVVAENRRLARENAELLARLDRLENTVEKLAAAAPSQRTRIASR